MSSKSTYETWTYYENTKTVEVTAVRAITKSLSAPPVCSSGSQESSYDTAVAERTKTEIVTDF